jgi:hypothetical protein
MPRFVGVTGLVAALSALALAVAASPSLAANSAGQGVALIPEAVPAQGPNGTMPTSSYVTGFPSESFSRFSFNNVPVNQVPSANLGQYATVALNQVDVNVLPASAKAALREFVTGGGKLVIHDADETLGNDYSFLLGSPPKTTYVGAGCINCGAHADPSKSSILANSGVISSNPADASYVNLDQLITFTDQGDANLLVSNDQRWQTLVKGTNGDNESGAEVAYARNGSGLIIYNGFDTDFINATAGPLHCDTIAPAYTCPSPGPTADWLAQMWFSELALNPSAVGGSGIPPTTPVVNIGTPISSGSAGLPASPVHAGHACVARKSLRLALKRFAHLRHRKIVQVDVYVNGRHRFRERRHFSNRTVRRLPAHGRYTITVIATTKRGYHLIAKKKYRAC